MTEILLLIVASELSSSTQSAYNGSRGHHDPSAKIDRKRKKNSGVLTSLAGNICSILTRPSRWPRQRKRDVEQAFLNNDLRLIKAT
jgi:hypothetical protein